MTTGACELLTRGFRIVRALPGEPESPWPGSLVCGPDGQLAVAVDADLLGADWAGWDAATDGHVLTPVDILRRPDGHDALVPVCTERVGDFLRRRSAEAELSSGEAVTLAVSLLRGLAELADREQVCGTWWLTDAGRPVFAAGSGSTALREGTCALLRELADSVPELTDLADALDIDGDPRRLRRTLDRAEEVLFAAAEPVALATTTVGPRRARRRALADGDAATAPPQRPERSLPLALVRHLDADWADVVSRTTTGLWRRVRTRAGAGRRPWLLAGGLAAAIIAGGMLWPAPPGESATAETAVVSGTPAPSPGPVPSPEPDAGAPTEPADADARTNSAVPDAPPPADADVDLQAVAAGLLTERTACGKDPECLRAVMERPDASFPPGVVDLPASERSLALIDEFGGAAVLRVEALESPPQLVVIVQGADAWLLRDVHDVAQQ